MTCLFISDEYYVLFVILSFVALFFNNVGAFSKFSATYFAEDETATAFLMEMALRIPF